MNTSTQHTTLATRIAQILKEHKLSLSDVGRRLKLSPAAVHRWRNGDVKNLKLEHLFGLADMLGYQPRWIALGEGPVHAADTIPTTPTTNGEAALLEDYRACLPADRAALERTARLYRLAAEKAKAA